MSSPLWVAAFRLAAVSIAAGEAAPVASCNIPATGREGGMGGERAAWISSRNTLFTSPCPALPHAQHRALPQPCQLLAPCCQGRLLATGYLKHPPKESRLQKKPWPHAPKGSGSLQQVKSPNTSNAKPAIRFNANGLPWLSATGCSGSLRLAWPPGGGSQPPGSNSCASWGFCSCARGICV